MMRIVAGIYKGHNLHAAKSGVTRPISDKAKEGLFSMLGDIEGLSMLDGYAGSGSIALEALSRGAESAVAVEQDHDAYEAICANARHVGLGDEFQVEHMSVARWLDTSQDVFDLVFADPPFDAIDTEELVSLADRSLRLFMYKHPRRSQPLEIENMELARSRRYGESTISIYKRNT